MVMTNENGLVPVDVESPWKVGVVDEVKRVHAQYSGNRVKAYFSSLGFTFFMMLLVFAGMAVSAALFVDPADPASAESVEANIVPLVMSIVFVPLPFASYAALYLAYIVKNGNGFWKNFFQAVPSAIRGSVPIIIVMALYGAGALGVLADSSTVMTLAGYLIMIIGGFVLFIGGQLFTLAGMTGALYQNNRQDTAAGFEMGPFITGDNVIRSIWFQIKLSLLMTVAFVLTLGFATPYITALCAGVYSRVTERAFGQVRPAAESSEQPLF